jgi:hypothetical protein
LPHQRDEQLEHRAKFKLILPHEISGYNVAAGHLFDPTFGAENRDNCEDRSGYFG